MTPRRAFPAFPAFPALLAFPASSAFLAPIGLSIASTIAVAACAGAAPSPHSVDECDERTARAFREALKGDTIFIREWGRPRVVTNCRDDEAAAACEARARAKALRPGMSAQNIYSCTNEPGGHCVVLSHNDEILTVSGKGTTWDAIGDSLWRRLGAAEVDVITMSTGDERRASATARGDDDDAPRRSMVFMRGGSRDEVRSQIKALSPNFSALRISVRSGDDSTRWFLIDASCRPKDEPPPSAHEGPWYCFTGPSENHELTVDECYVTAPKCAKGRESLAKELRFRGVDNPDISQCAPAPRVSCFEMSSEYASSLGWRSFRSYYCYPSPERCQQIRPNSPLLHAGVESQCFDAGR